jgi:hypothetical protein
MIRDVMFIDSTEEVEKPQKYCYKICLSNKFKIMSDDTSVESHLSNVIRKDMDAAYAHIDRHNNRSRVIYFLGKCIVYKENSTAVSTMVFFPI